MGRVQCWELQPEVGRGTDLVLLGQRLPEVGVALVHACIEGCCVQNTVELLMLAMGEIDR